MTTTRFSNGDYNDDEYRIARQLAATYTQQKLDNYAEWLAVCHCPSPIYRASYLYRDFCKLCNREIEK
jgi:hypothetical protein